MIGNSAQGTLYVPVTSRAASVTTVKKVKRQNPKGPYARLDWVDRNQLSEEDQASTPAYCAGAYVELSSRGIARPGPCYTANSWLLYSIRNNRRWPQHLTGDVVVRQGYRQVKSNKSADR